MLHPDARSLLEQALDNMRQVTSYKIFSEEDSVDVRGNSSRSSHITIRVGDNYYTYPEGYSSEDSEEWLKYGNKTYNRHAGDTGWHEWPGSSQSPIFFDYGDSVAIGGRISIAIPEVHPANFGILSSLAPSAVLESDEADFYRILVKDTRLASRAAKKSLTDFPIPVPDRLELAAEVVIQKESGLITEITVDTVIFSSANRLTARKTKMSFSGFGEEYTLPTP
jgi:hypothetical protein